MGYTFIMAGGGTGGHVIPGLAVARELKARGHQAVFIGTRDGHEARLVPDAGFPIEWISIGGLARVGIAQTLRTMTQLPASVLTARAILKRHDARGVFSMGGYVAAPVMLAAAALGTKMILMEPNAIAGLTNRRLGRFADRALISFEQCAAYFPAGRAELTGLPVRAEFFALPPKPRGEQLNILVTGGSRGSRTLNTATRGCWNRIPGARVRLQCGRDAYPDLLAEMGDSVTPFLADMPKAFAEADLIICRSGAGAVAELAAAGKPAILIPFPFAADDHQFHNAEAMRQAGAARLVRDGEFTSERMIAEIAAAGPMLGGMSENARQLARPNAAARAATLLEQFAQS